MNNLTKWNICEQIRKLAIPVSIWMFFDTMYNVVDSYFAWIYSTDALAAVSVSFPIFFLIIAFWYWMWSWVSVLISNSIWEENEEKTKIYIWESLSFWLILWTLLTFLWLYFGPYLLKLLWAEWNFLILSIQYTSIIFLSSMFFIIMFFANSILQSNWDTRSYWKALVISFFLNVIFDPIFIYGIWPFKWFWFNWIAIATVLTTGFAAFYLAYKVILLGYFEKFKLSNLKPNISIYKEIIKQWLPSSINMLTVAIWIFVITYFVWLYSKEAIAAYWLITRIEQIVLMPTIWINTAVLVLVSQSNWAKLFDRIDKILKTAFLYGLIILISIVIPIFIFAENILWFFTSSKEVINIWVLGVRVWAFTSISYLVLFMYTSALQWMKKPNFALWIWLYRQIIAPWILFYLITSIFFFEIWFIWWAIFTINWSAAIITYFYTIYVIKKLKNT